MLRHNKIVTKSMNGYKAIKTHAFIIGIFQRIRTIFRKKKLKFKNLRIKSKIFLTKFDEKLLYVLSTLDNHF